MFGLPNLKIVGAALVVAFLLAGVAGWKGYSLGKTAGALDALRGERDQLKERNETNAEVNSLDRHGLCLDILDGLPDCDEFKP